MKKIYLLITVSILFVIIISSLLFVDIPSPSKLISESYELEIK